MAQKATLKRKFKTLSPQVKKAVREYLRLLKEDEIPLEEVIVFGSQAKGKRKKSSDIDLCIISPKFKDPFKALAYLLFKAYQVKAFIEPHPYHPKDFREEDPLVWEIKKTGVKVKI